MKKKFKQILSALLVAVMLIGIAPMDSIVFTQKVSAYGDNENCSNVNACYYNGEYYYFSSMVLYKYNQSSRKNEAIFNGDYTSSISVFEDTMYIVDEDNIYYLERNTNKVKLFYKVGYYNLSLFFKNNKMIVSAEYTNKVIFLNLDTKRIVGEIDGQVLDIVGDDLYYQVIDDSSKTIYLKKYVFSTSTLTDVWHSSFRSVLEYYNYSVAIYDFKVFEQSIFFISGETQGSGKFFYGYLYRIDKDGAIYRYSNGIGTNILLYDNSIFVTSGKSKYDGNVGLLKVEGNSLVSYETDIFHIGELNNGLIVNYNVDGLYMYDVKEKLNKCIVESDTLLSQYDYDINEYIKNENMNLKKSYFSINYYETYYLHGLIISNPEICIDAGWIDNTYHSVKECEPQFISFKNIDPIFHENSYIADIWLSRNREKTPESKLIDSIFDLDSLSTVIYDDLKNNRDFQESVNMWTGMKVIFDPEKGIEDIYLSEEDLYETLIFDLVKKIMYGKNEDTGNVIIDAANTASGTVGKVTKYKGYIDKIATITTEPEKNLLEILKDWKFNPKSDSYSKFYGMLNDADQASSKWTDNKFIEGIGTIADISSDVAEFYKRLACYIMLEDMSEETVNLLETLKEQTSNEKFKNALEKVIVAYNNYNIVSIICTMKLTQDTALDIGGAAFDDLAKCSRVYSTLRAGYKVGVALCDITMNTSKTIDAYKICGATKEFINANKAAINVLKNKYLTSRNDFDAGVYVNAIRAYQYAFEIDMENGIEFVKKANDEGLVNKARKLTAHAFNFFLNKDNKTSYESMAESQKSILNTMKMNFSTLNNTWKFNSDYLRSDYPDIFPVYVKKEISQSKYAPNITSAYIDKSGKTLLTWNRPLIFKDKYGNVQTLWGSLTFDGIYATETVGGSKNTYDNANINEAPSTIEFYNASKFKTFNKDYTLAAYTDTTDGKVYSAAKKISVGNPLLKAEIRVASASEAGSAQVMFSIIDDTSSRYDSLKYTIYRKSDGGSWTKIDDIARETARFNGKLTLYKDTTAKKGQKYSYKVVSHMTFDNGMTLNSPESSAVSVIGGVGMKKLDIYVRDRLPQIRTRSTNEEKKGIELSWTRTANVDGYEIYRIASYGTVYQLIKTVGKDAASYVDYDVDACTTYKYIVCPYYNNEEKVYDLAALEQGTADYKVAKIYSVDVSDITMNYKKSTTITPSITADDGAKYTVKYSSSNTKVATVDQNGKVYAAKKGSATITCTVTDSNGNTVQDTCKVTVKYSFGQWLIKILLFGWIWY